MERVHLVGTPAPADRGAYPVNIRAMRADGQFLDAVFTVEVANAAPFVRQPLSDQTAELGIPFTLPIEALEIFEDPEGDPFDLSASNIPSGLAFFNDTFSGLPDALGTTLIALTATDIFGANVSNAFNFTVRAPAPSTTSPPVSDSSSDSSEASNSGVVTAITLAGVVLGLGICAVAVGVASRFWLRSKNRDEEHGVELDDRIGRTVPEPSQASTPAKAKGDGYHLEYSEVPVEGVPLDSEGKCILPYSAWPVQRQEIWDVHRYRCKGQPGSQQYSTWIGQGHFSQVYVGFLPEEGEGGEWVSVKEIIGDKVGPCEQEGILHGKVYEKNGGRGILKPYHTLIAPDRSKAHQVTALARYDGKYLADLLAEHPGLRDRILTVISYELLDGGLATLKEARIPHVDLKPDNLLIAPDGALKIGDFGSAFDTAEGPIPYNQPGDDWHFSWMRMKARNEGCGELNGTREDAWQGALAMVLIGTGRQAQEVLEFTGLQISAARDKIKGHEEQYYRERLLAIPELQEPARDTIWWVLAGMLGLRGEPLPVEEALRASCFTQMDHPTTWKGLFDQLDPDLDTPQESTPQPTREKREDGYETGPSPLSSPESTAPPQPQLPHEERPYN